MALDELWQVIGAGPGMVARVNEITRSTALDATGLLMITHTGRDLETPPTEADIKTAKGQWTPRAWSCAGDCRSVRSRNASPGS